jgi:SlyX protein
MPKVDSVLIELETRIAFQEDALNSLNDVVATQNREIQELRSQLKLLYKKMDDLNYSMEQNSDDSDSPPPHY